jgi:hypothetical protein
MVYIVTYCHLLARYPGITLRMTYDIWHMAYGIHRKHRKSLLDTSAHCSIMCACVRVCVCACVRVCVCDPPPKKGYPLDKASFQY